jgi:thiol-disulfide isomerase/thioredoxin
MNKIFLVCLIIGCLIITAGCVTHSLPVNKTDLTIQPTPTPKPPVLIIKYFTTTNCPLCQQIDLLLVNLTEKYPNRMNVTRYDLIRADNRATYATYAIDLKVKVIPFIVVNEKNLLVNYSEIVTHLEPMLKGDERII